MKLIELNRKNSEHGFILNRDDICEFFIPMTATFTPIISSKPENVSLNVVFFDKTETKVLQGEEIISTLREIIKVFGSMNYHYNGEVSISVNVKSIGIPSIAGLTGKVNPKSLSFAKDSVEEVNKLLTKRKIRVLPAALVSTETQECTIGFAISNTDTSTISDLNASFETKEHPTINLVTNHTGDLLPNQTANFSIPFRFADMLNYVLQQLPNANYRLVFNCRDCHLATINGLNFQTLYREIMSDFHRNLEK